MSNSTSQISEFLVQIQNNINEANEQEIEQIISHLLKICYFLLDKLESIIIEKDCQISQLQQFLDNSKLEMQRQLELVDEYCGKYSEQLQYNYLLELNISKLEQRLQEANQNAEQLSGLFQENQNQFLYQKNTLSSQIRELQHQEKQNKTESTELIQELKLKISNLELELSIEKQKNNNNLQQFQRSLNLQNEKQGSLHSIVNQSNFEKYQPLQSLMKSITEFFYDKQQNTSFHLCCYPSLMSLDKKSCASLTYLNRQFDESPTQKKIFAQNVHIQTNPYHIFFTLITQCVKLDINDYRLLECNIDHYYDNLLSNKIPYNQWYLHIKNELLKQIY